MFGRADGGRVVWLTPQAWPGDQAEVAFETLSIDRDDQDEDVLVLIDRAFTRDCMDPDCGGQW